MSQELEAHIQNLEERISDLEYENQELNEKLALEQEENRDLRRVIKEARAILRAY